MDQVAEIFWQEIMERAYHLNRKGYAIISDTRDCPFAYPNGQVLRCRYVAWVFGMLKNAEDTVHHCDFDKLNDHPDNLKVMSRSAHAILHTTPMPPLQRAKIAAAHRGKKYTEELRRKLSEAHKGFVPSEATRLKISALMKGRQITWTDKISVALKGRKLSPEWIEKMRATKLAQQYKMTDAERTQVSENMKVVWESRRSKYNERAKQIVELRRQGLTLVAIGKQMNLSAPSICRYLARV